MRTLVSWAVRNAAAMNTLMIGALLLGGWSLLTLRREQFPEFELEVVLVNVAYPGATPEEIEEGICQKVEESIRSIDGIKKMTSVAQEGLGSVILELESTVDDVQKVLNEVRSEVDRIPAFPPELAEEPEVKQITFRQAAIKLGVSGPSDSSLEADLKLRELAEEIRREVIALPEISQARIAAAREYQIDVEIPEETLRRHGLSLQDVARAIRRENIELPGGKIKTDEYEVLLRGKNKRTTGEQIAELPLVTDAQGVVYTVGELGTVRDGFVDATAITEINGRPALTVVVDRTRREDVMDIASAVGKYAETKRTDLPPGYQLEVYGDESRMVADRLSMLTRNGIQALVLVFVILALFLELRLAFWVALGIPVAMLGAGGYLLSDGQTLNMLSMFAFIMALGIVVDDAIVVGENIYEHRQMGKKPLQAAIDGTCEVLPAVTSSVLTTVIAFMPLLFVSGVMGKFIAVMPAAVIAMLLISLVESAVILPVHLSHRRGPFMRLMEVLLWPFRWVGWLFYWASQLVSELLHQFVHKLYGPVVRQCVAYPAVVLSTAIAMLLLSVGVVLAGWAPLNAFPKLDAETITARITYADGTPSWVTDASTRELVAAYHRAEEQLTPEGENLTELVTRSVGLVAREEGGPASAGSEESGSHLGVVDVQLAGSDARSVSSEQILALWRQEWQKVNANSPGIETLTFAARNFGPPGGAIEFKIVGPADQWDQVEAAVEKAKARLRGYPGVYDLADDSQEGKFELRPVIKEDAKALGVRTADVMETVRSSFYGEEVMRLQRGRHEVKLMVRYPPEERQAFDSLEEIRVRLGDGAERPLPELASISPKRGYSEINRLDQLRSITITADVDESKANGAEVLADFRKNFEPELKSAFPAIAIRYEGRAEQTQESLSSLGIGVACALLAMFFLLTIQFRSVVQPILILAIIPFGCIGAILGHTFLGLELTLFSFFGLVALTGVVVNDSIVLVDYINSRVRLGVPIAQAASEGSIRRLRPVLLTSLTTVAGLLPILWERSFQAQILIPMAVSLAFGLMLATALVLILVPSLYALAMPAVHAFASRIEAEDEQGEQAGRPLLSAGDGQLKSQPAIAATEFPEPSSLMPVLTNGSSTGSPQTEEAETDSAETEADEQQRKPEPVS